MKKIIFIFVFLMSSLSYSMDSRIFLGGANVEELIVFLNDWDQFKTALNDYAHDESEFFEGCDVYSLSINDFISFHIYSRVMAEKHLGSLVSLYSSEGVRFIGVATKDPCGYESNGHSWFAIEKNGKYKILKNIILVGE